MPYFIRCGSVFPVDEGECSYKSAEKVVFTVYPVKNGKFTARYFNDDGESFEYLKNNCVKLEFDVNCDNENVDVVVNNKGNVKFEPEIKLVSTDLRIISPFWDAKKQYQNLMLLFYFKRQLCTMH